MRPVFKRVDTCAAEFEAYTPYLPTHEEECEAAPTDRRKVMILGGGPNRIGQGIEFDYCCARIVRALAAGFETIMVNRYLRDGLDRLRHARPALLRAGPPSRTCSRSCTSRSRGIIVQYGGQTPLKLAVPLHELGVPIFGTTPDAIDRAEDRERFSGAT